MLAAPRVRSIGLHHPRRAVQGIPGVARLWRKVEDVALAIHVLLHKTRGAAKVIGALIHLRDTHPRSQKIATEFGYLRHDRKRIRYAGWARRRLPIGSGVTEAACKTLVTQRMKRSGTRWRHDGGQAILTFRGWAQSD